MYNIYIYIHTQDELYDDYYLCFIYISIYIVFLNNNVDELRPPPFKSIMGRCIYLLCINIGIEL